MTVSKCMTHQLVEPVAQGASAHAGCARYAAGINSCTKSYNVLNCLEKKNISYGKNLKHETYKVGQKNINSTRVLTNSSRI